MVLKDRHDAGEKLAALLKQEKNAIALSLLRGGIVVGAAISQKLHISHLPLVVTKIPAIHNEELALGAVCFDISYLESGVVRRLTLKKSEISRQIKIAQNKFQTYCKRFQIKQKAYSAIKDKTVILVDDGIATGSTARAALLYIKSHKPNKVILATPVAPYDFDAFGFDTFVTLHQDENFNSVSQFYQKFPQVEDEEVKELLDK